MRQHLTGAILRSHGRLNLRLWDRLIGGIGGVLVGLGFIMWWTHDKPPAIAALVGGLLIVTQTAHEQRRHRATVWDLAAGEDDPVAALCLYEYLYRLRWHDLLVCADWRAAREALGLPVWSEDPDAPPAVLAAFEHLARVPAEK